MVVVVNYGTIVIYIIAVMESYMRRCLIRNVVQPTSTTLKPNGVKIKKIFYHVVKTVATGNSLRLTPTSAASTKNMFMRKQQRLIMSVVDLRHIPQKIISVKMTKNSYQVIII